ncbi:MAG: N-acyl homoserine lactonase family protein [Sulfurifustis sp.]
MTRTKRYASFAGAGIAVLFIAACSSQPTAPKAAVEKMYVFDCGHIDVGDISVFTGQEQDKGKTKPFTVSCYLIEHKNGTLLWDTGLPDALAQMPNGTKMGPFTLSVQKPLTAQLKELGYAPENIRYVAFSHMHADHSGNGNSFTKSTVLMQTEEYNAAFGSEPQKYRFNPDYYGKLKDSKFVKLNGDYDVFGDGSVVIKRAVGHTPGHQSLYVNLPKSGPVVLSGDIAHFFDNWEHKRVPAFNFDKNASLESMENMEKFLKKSGAKLLIQHDAEQNQKVPHVPQPYL